MDISTALAVLEGNVQYKKLVEISKQYKALGFKGVTLGDTTGMATPPIVKAAIREIQDNIQILISTLHFHNTRGVGLANVLIGLNEGIYLYESVLMNRWLSICTRCNRYYLFRRSCCI